MGAYSGKKMILFPVLMIFFIFWSLSLKHLAFDSFLVGIMREMCILRMCTEYCHVSWYWSCNFKSPAQSHPGCWILGFLKERRKEGKVEFIRSAHTSWFEPSPTFMPVASSVLLKVIVGCSLSAVCMWSVRSYCKGNLNMGKKTKEGGKFQIVLKARTWGAGKLWFWSWLCHGFAM